MFYKGVPLSLLSPRGMCHRMKACKKIVIPLHLHVKQVLGRQVLGRVNCPCPEQGRNPNSQLSIAIFAPILPTDPEDHDQTIHRVPVNGLIVILTFYG